MTSETPPQARLARGNGEWAALFAAAVCLLAIFWMGLGWDALTRRETYVGKKGDYYSSLVHGFLAGHLYLDRKPDPRLDSPDPATVRAADTLLDASYYNHHFYLYFGAAPAALFLLPYAWITGNDLDPRFIVFLCVCIGFLFSFGTWRLFARAHAPHLGAQLQFFGVVALGFAPATPLLLTRSMFYEVVIAAGYACVMAGAFWIYRAISGRGRPEFQLAAASLCLGLAVGCRPDLVLTVPALSLAALALGRWGRDREPLSQGLVRFGAAAVIPAALVGSCIGAYNFERFGSPFDFGFRYSQNSFFAGHHSMARADFFLTNLRWDYLTFPSLSPYFPYVFPEAASFRPSGFPGGEAIHGQFPIFVLVIFVAVSGILLRRRLKPGRAAIYLGIVAWMFLAPFTVLSFLGLRADRYLVDFQQSLVLATVLLASLVATALTRAGGRALWVTLFGVLTLAVTAFNLFAGLQEFDAFKDLRFTSYNALETIGNVPSSWLERLGVLGVGPVEMKVVFPRDLKVSRIEPLVSLGTPELSDSLYVIEHEGGEQIEFMDDHHGYGGHRSPVIDIVPGKPYTLRIDMGALYPPPNHPFFGTYSVLQERLAKTRLRVEMDGKEVWKDMMNSYDAPPWTLEPGRNDTTLTLFGTAFTGNIFSVKRPEPPPPEAVPANNGLWRIRCVLPVQLPNRRFPLLSLGLTGSGTLIFVTTLPNNRLSFGDDEWGNGGTNSGIVSADGQKEHVIEVFIGPLAGATDWPKEWAVAPRRLADEGHTLRLWMDGRPLLEANLRREFDLSDSFIDVGTNLQGFSSAEPYFFGDIRSVPFSADEAREFLKRNLLAEP
jgi:hypothetical protein